MPARFDVFLSHASPDKPLVEELARRLTREDLKPWLDKWNLIPGTAWQPEIETVLADCLTCAVIIGAGGFGPWHHEEMRLAIGRRVEDRAHAFRVIPVLLPGVERPERSRLPGFLTATTWVEFRDTLDDPEAFRRLLCGVRGIEPGDGAAGAAFEGRNPYRGLELFDVDHAALFFGREALTEWLLDALRRKPAGDESRFLAIVGASGSGKSSLARAGLMAALKDGRLDGSAAWPRAICRPGAEPFFGLANALKGVAPEADRALVFDRLQGRKDGDRSLHVAAGLALGEPPRAERLVVLVDQFEEVFTLCDDEPERRAFIANLLHAATVAGGRTIVVLTMRADFYPRCAAYADLAAALSDHQVLVGPMADDELRRAIDRPARLAGLEPEPGLVELLVDDIRGRAGALPLLQFALQEVWRRREDYRLTIRTYREIGGIEGALQQKADAVYDAFTPAQQEICRRVFLRLVQPGEGSEDTRRRASLRELLPDDPAQAGAVQSIIDRLADPESRLLTTERQQATSGEGTLEVAHEALIRGWPTLRKWIETDRAGLRIHLRLTEAAKEWADADEAAREAMLYEGARLAVAGEWAAAHRDELGALEGAFLSASQEHERQRKADDAEKNRRLAEAEHRRAEEAEARKREAESSARRQKRLGQVLSIAAAASLVLALAALWESRQANMATQAAKKSEERASEKEKLATRNEQRAKELASIATSRQLAAFSASERNRRLDLALLLAVQALQTTDTAEARASLFDALRDRPGLESFLQSTEGTVWSVAFSPDGQTLAVGYGDVDVGGVVLWDVAGRRRLSEQPLIVKEGGVWSMAFSPDGQTLVAAYTRGVVLWDVAGRRRVSEQPLPVDEGGVRSVAFSRDGKVLAADSDRGVVLWDVAGRRRLSEKPLTVKNGSIQGVAFSPDGKILAAGYGQGADGDGVELWDTADWRPVPGPRLGLSEGHVGSLAFSPDGQALAAGYGGGSAGGVVLWDAAGRRRLSEKPLTVDEGEVVSVAFGRDGKTLASTYAGGVVLWDVADRRRLPGQPLPVNEGGARSVAFSRDGQTLAVGYVGGVMLWDAAGRQRSSEGPLAVNGAGARSATFSPDGQTLAVAYGGDNVGGGVVLWDVAGRRRLSDQPLPVNEGTITSVAFSPDGKALAAAYSGRGIRAVDGVVLWDTAGRNRLSERPLLVNKGTITSVAFSRDGQTLAAAYTGGVALWDVAGRRRLSEQALPVEGGVAGASAAFGPDGALAAGCSGGLMLWDAAGRRLSERPLPVHEGYITSVAFNPGGDTLAAGYGDVDVGGVVLWDAAGRRRLSGRPLPVNEGRVRCVAFSPDGKALAAAYEGTGIHGVVLWDAASRRRLAERPLAVNDGTVWSVAFSPDGRTLGAAYGGGGRGGVLRWDLDLESWKHRAARIANRNFTRDEWRQYLPDEPYRATFPDLPVPPEVLPQAGEGPR